MPETFVFCSNCGTQAPATATFCQKCGASLGPAPSGVVAPPLIGNRGYGGFWIRFVAIIIDGIVISIVFFPIRVIILSITGGAYQVHVDEGDFGSVIAMGSRAFPLLIGSNTVVHWLYEALLTSSSWQGTLGKKLLNLRVTDEAGNRISFARATGRYFAKIPSGLFLFIGFIMAGFTDRKRALHDFIAGTLVVKG